MDVSCSPCRIDAGQSLNETATSENATGDPRHASVFTVSMTLTTLAAFVLVPGSARSDPAVGHATAVVVARAQIVAGVRISSEQIEKDSNGLSRSTRLPKPRERACLEIDKHPCRLIVVEMP